MNIVLVMSGGAGLRFGASIPKQYNLIAGRPVIDYVLDAVGESKRADRTVIVMNKEWAGYSERVKTGDFDIAPNGITRIESVYNGLRLIRSKYPCEKLVIVDAVGPFIYAQLIDDYFDKLDRYDAVITAQKITGGFTDIHNSKLDRDDYIITQSPEAFRFEIFWNNFDSHFAYQEMAGMLPEESSRYYNFEFKNNLKLTYDFELLYCEFMLKNLGKINSSDNVAFFDKSVLLTEGLRSYLLRNQPKETTAFIDEVYSNMPRLIAKWGVTYFHPSQLSRFGLVLKARSNTHGDVVIKFIPGFVDRYERELEAMRVLPPSYMCGLLDVDESCNCMLLQMVKPAKFASFEENIKLTRFFEKAVSDAVPYSEELSLEFIPPYLEELRGKLENVDLVPYCREEVGRELEAAVTLYNEIFATSDLYVLHGDLHEENILDDGERFWGIDPNGLLAPIEFECVRFIRNDVRNHVAFGYEERFEVLLQSMSRFVDRQRLCAAFVIDMAFCTFNSTFENEFPDETLVDLKLIDIAKRWLETHS